MWLVSDSTCAAPARHWRDAACMRSLPFDQGRRVQSTVCVHCPMIRAGACSQCLCHPLFLKAAPTVRPLWLGLCTAGVTGLERQPGCVQHGSTPGARRATGKSVTPPCHPAHALHHALKAGGAPVSKGAASCSACSSKHAAWAVAHGVSPPWKNASVLACIKLRCRVNASNPAGSRE